MERRLTHSHASLRAAVVALAVVAAGCARSGAPVSTPQATRAPLEVDAVAPDSSASGELVLPGRVKALGETSVVARLSGRISAMLVREGERVRAGQPVARFDAPESRRALEAARRERVAARQSLETSARQSARFDSLVARGVASARERELVETQNRDAESRAAAAASTVESLEAALELRAPFAGVIVRRHVDVGADVTTGMPVYDVRSNDGVEIVSAVPESALPAVRIGRWDVQGADGIWQPARLQQLDGMTDPETRSRRARLATVAPLAEEPGAFVRVRLRSSALADAPGWSVPTSAIVSRGALRGAFVVANDRAELRWLRLGRADGDRVEVLAGLRPGDRVAREAHGLSDGAPVRVRP
jgi:RND family efflux transporter MFP subunit